MLAGLFLSGHDLEGENAELPILGELIGKTADQMYMGVAELRRRDLLQQRGVWRAVLPHAIANRLAPMALQDIPPQRIDKAIINGKSDRLLRSFSRRLGYLDTSKEARALVAAWLAPGGLLHDVLNLSDLGNAIFHNVAPVMPEAVLAALERAIAQADDSTLERSKHFISLIRSLAFDPEFFERATALLLCFHAIDTDRNVDDEAGRVIVSFCYLYLSGTHATVQQCLALVEKLLRSPEPKQQGLGAQAIEAMFETDHFTSSYLFEFGARSRDHGYYPKTDADVVGWFGSALKLSEAIAATSLPVAEQVKKAVAGGFRGLWANTQLSEELDRMARAFAGNGFWRDGWIAARQTRAYETKTLSPDSLAKLRAVEEFLRPKDLVAKVRGIVLEAKGGGLGYDETDDAQDLDTYDFEAAEKRTAEAIEQLGRDMAADTDSFQEMLPELLSSGGGRLFPFGAALAQGGEQPRAVWDALVGQLSTNPVIMGGFLSGLQTANRAEVDAMLDDALTNPALITWFPYLQASVLIDDKGLARIHCSLELGHSPIERYSHLAWGRTSDPIPGAAFRDLVVAICDKGGVDSALHMVSMRLVADRSAKRSPLFPNSWSGSWATEMESRFRLLVQLDVGDNVDLRAARKDVLDRLRSQIEEARVREAAEDKQRNARFE